uniref:Putative secreted protein n=1 Tax=Ixodes ricinus TaxID=34613 RepID=A0A6B0UUI7_IXORI
MGPFRVTVGPPMAIVVVFLLVAACSVSMTMVFPRADHRLGLREGGVPVPTVKKIGVEGGGPSVPRTFRSKPRLQALRGRLSALRRVVRDIAAFGRDKPGNHPAIEAGKLGVILHDFLLHNSEVIVHGSEEKFVIWPIENIFKVC